MLPGNRRFRQAFRYRNSKPRHSKAQVFGLNSLHELHVIWSMHAPPMIVKKEHNGSRKRNCGKDPAGPLCRQSSACPPQLDNADNKQHHRKRFVLQNFHVMSEPEIPTWRSERPQLRVTENQNENTRKKKAKRP